MPLVFTDSTWETSDLTNDLADGNGSNGNTSGSGNVQAPVPAVTFVDDSMPANELRIEVWADVASLGNGLGVEYPLDMVVTYEGFPYRCQLDPCPAGQTPPDFPATWEPLDPFVDDLRVLPGTVYDGYGLSAAHVVP